MTGKIFRLPVVSCLVLIALLPISSAPADTSRLLVVISDLHIGIGRNNSGAWDPTEDFRWPKALKSFLDHISNKGNNRVDLMIAGDFLELWQPPPDIECRGKGPDLGCSIPEVKQIVARIIDAHKDEFAAIADFAQAGSNHVYVMPGNHDAAIVIPEVWALVAVALQGDNGRISLVKDGIWTTSDGQVLIEHGHQIGSDANRFADWPRVTAPGKDGQEYLIRPWGELFVQRLFNDEEKNYPIIDNLSPESVGVKYRMADRGVWHSAGDIARFVAFNLFQTSLGQKIDSLGETGTGGAQNTKCTVEEGRALGHRLLVESLPWNDPLRDQIEAKDEAAQKVRAELDILARRLPEEDIAQLCEQRSERPLGAFIERTFVPRKNILGKHLDKRLKNYPDATLFIYGHTHQLEEGWDVRVDKYHRNVTVLNSGAFQRLIDEPGYMARADKEKPWKGLREIDIEKLPACYSAVFVQYGQNKPSAEVKLWQMEEDSTGHERSPGTSFCK